MTPEVPEYTPRGNVYDRRIADRDTLLGALIAEDRWAVAALERKDDLALLRRIAKAGLDDARPLAIERAFMRGRGNDRALAKALGITVTELRPYIAAIYTRANA